MEYVLGNYLDVDIAGTFDMALMVMCDYSALSPEQRRRLLGRLTSLLGPGGRFAEANEFAVIARRPAR